MFRRLETGLPQSHQFPVDLESLGFFINDKNQIRCIKSPGKGFAYRITNDDQNNERHREAFYTAVRSEISCRLKQLGMSKIYLPQLVIKKPEAPHISILSSPPQEMCTKRRIIIVVNDEFQDLGNLSCNIIEGELGLEVGSCLALIRELISRSEKCLTSSSFSGEQPASTPDASTATPQPPSLPGIVILNPGQLLYSYSLAQSMSPRCWNTRQVASAVHPPIAVDAQNYVDGNRTPEEHVAFVFDKVIADNCFVHRDAELYVIGMQNRGDLILQYLNSSWARWEGRIQAIALTDPRHLASSITDPGLRSFLVKRGRAWSVSAAPVGHALAAPSPMIAAVEHLVTTDGRGEHAPQRSKQGELEHTGYHSPGVESYINWCESFPANDHANPITNLSSPPAEQEVRGKSNDTPLESVKAEQVWAEPQQDYTVTQPVYSAGDLIWSDCIFPTVFKSVLDWFDDVARAPSSYKNPPLLESELWQDPGLPASERDPVDGSGELLTLEDGSLTMNAVPNLDPTICTDTCVHDKQYAGGESDARAEHGAFAVKDEHPPQAKVVVAGACLPAALIDAAGLGGDESESSNIAS